MIPAVIRMCRPSVVHPPQLISPLPLQRPVAAVRVSRVDGAFKINPSRAEMDEADITLVVAGTDEAICMVEGGANEADEASMIDAMDLAHAEIKKIVGAIEELRSIVGQEKWPVADAPVLDETIVAVVEEKGKASFGGGHGH